MWKIIGLTNYKCLSQAYVIHGTEWAIKINSTIDVNGLTFNKSSRPISLLNLWNVFLNISIWNRSTRLPFFIRFRSFSLTLVIFFLSEASNKLCIVQKASYTSKASAKMCCQLWNSVDINSQKSKNPVEFRWQWLLSFVLVRTMCVEMYDGMQAAVRSAKSVINYHSILFNHLWIYLFIVCRRKYETHSFNDTLVSNFYSFLVFFFLVQCATVRYAIRCLKLGIHNRVENAFRYSFGGFRCLSKWAILHSPKRKKKENEAFFIFGIIKIFNISMETIEHLVASPSFAHVNGWFWCGWSVYLNAHQISFG